MQKIITKITNPSRALQAFLLSIGLVVYASVAFANISKASIWFDEAFGAYLIRFNFWDIARFTGQDVHPPLYYWCLKGWSELFGTTELALRSMSVLFGVIAIIFVFLIVRRWIGVRAALASLGLMIITPFFIRYSQEARMYTMVAAIVFAATYVLLLATERKKFWLWVIYGALVGLGMLTHYFAALAWLAHLVWHVVTVRKSGVRGFKTTVKKAATKEWVVAYVVAIGVFLAWIPFFVQQLVNVQANGFWIPPVTPVTTLDFLTNTFVYEQATQVRSWLALIFIAMFIVAILLGRKYFKARSHGPAQLLGLIALVPPVLLILASMPPLQSSFVNRYIVPSSLALVACFAIILSAVKIGKTWRINGALYGLTVVLMLFGIANVYHYGNYNMTENDANNTRQLLEKVWQRSKPGEPIIASTPWMYYEAAFYSSDKHPVYFIDANTDYRYGSLEMLRQNDMGKIKDTSAFAKQHDRIWYVGYPRDNDLTAPVVGWREQQRLRFDDSITHKPAYQAIEYTLPSISAE